MVGNHIAISAGKRANKIASLSHADVHFADIEPPASGFSKQIAGILTSIGILGTFIGITVGLGQIGADMSGGSSEDMQNAMSSLISSLGVSFRTSIWGLISSMVITALTNSQITKLEKDDWTGSTGWTTPCHRNLSVPSWLSRLN